jgi:hypothetical protein
MDTDSTCWVCSLRFLPGERLSFLSSLGLDVHTRCAEQVLRDEPEPTDEPEPPR